MVRLPLRLSAIRRKSTSPSTEGEAERADNIRPYKAFPLRGRWVFAHLGKKSDEVLFRAVEVVRPYGVFYFAAIFWENAAVCVFGRVFFKTD